MASVALTGEIDLASKGRLEEIASLIGPDDADLELDLSGVTFMDSTGLNLLARLHRACEDHGGQLTLRAPSERVLALLKVSGLDTIVTVEP